MILDPDAGRVLAMMRAVGRPALQTLSVSEARQSFAASRPVLQPPPPEVAEARELAAGGIRLRLYRPLGAAADAVLPALIWFHGGGWVVGDLDSHDVVCRSLANAAVVCIVSVDYRLAPEHVFPAAVDDSAAATAWVIAHAAALRIDPARVGVGGDSAGGNLAAVMAIMARDGSLPKLAAQLLIYPVVDLTATQPSYGRVTDGLPLTAATMRWFRERYTPDPSDWTDWRASPLRAFSLARTAPALVLTVAHDPLCDEGMAYARRLELDGVRVMHLHVGDQFHGYVTMGRMIPAAATMLGALGAMLLDVLGSDPR